MGVRPRRQCSQLFVVEGLDDQYVAEAVMRREELDVTFTVEPRRSVGALIKAIGADVKAPGRTVIGFQFDANSDPASRWNDVVESLRDQYSVPRRPPSEGTIVSAEGMPTIGIWMMPNNGSPGELEDFVRGMVPSDDKVWSLAEAYIQGVPADARRQGDADRTKAVLHAWLAARRRPGRMGTAIEDNDLTTDGELAQSYVAWLRDLFCS